MISRVLVAIDGSQNSVRAAEHALKLMDMNHEMTMTVINVIPVLDRSGETQANDPGWKVEDQEKKLYKSSKIILDEVMMIFNKNGLEVRLAIEKGDAGEIIASSAVEGSYELIIMGLRGQNDNRDRDLGSVSQKVLRLATCPVTLVK